MNINSVMLDDRRCPPAHKHTCFVIAFLKWAPMHKVNIQGL